jgi:UDP:flavonoid glycosyltransferase YjiC (YdhE family)
MPDAAKPAVLVTAAKLAPEAVAILEEAGYGVFCTSGYPSEAELLAAVEEVLAGADAKAAAEAKQMANIEAGTHDAAWVDASLRRLGCEGLG